MKLLLDDPTTPAVIVTAFTAHFESHPVEGWPHASIDLIAYGVGARRITRWVAVTSTFKVLAHFDPTRQRVVHGEVPFKSYCTS